MQYEQCTLDEVAEAVGYLDAGCCREDWIKIGMAIKSEFGEGGMSTFEDWSMGSDKYDKDNFTSSWKSIKQGGRVTIATLFKQAIEEGYKPAKKEWSEEEKKKRQQEYAERRAQREKESAEEARLLAELQSQISLVCQQAWASDYLSVEGESAYLAEKQIPACGAKFVCRSFMIVVDLVQNICYALHDINDMKRTAAQKKKTPDDLSFLWFKKNTLVVPMFDMAGKLWSLQAITENGTKLFIKNSRKSDTCFLIGDLSSAPLPVCVAEGFATAGSIHLATQYPVFVCWDCGNMVRMAPQIKQAYPDYLLVVCGDDDPDELDEDDQVVRKGAGKKKAQEAAEAANGAWLVPDFSCVEAIA